MLQSLKAQLLSHEDVVGSGRQLMVLVDKDTFKAIICDASQV